VLVGAILRLLGPGHFLFRQDEAEHFAQALDLAAQGSWPVHSWPSSVGIPNGGTFLWILIALGHVTSDPRWGTALVALINVAALAMSVPLFRALLRGRGEAALAVALYATNPVAIWYSRKIWDPCVLALFAVPALLLTLRALDAGERKPGAAGAVLLVPPLLALGALAHQSAAFFGVVVLAILLAEWRRVPRAPLAAGLAVAIALVLPYARYLRDHAHELAARPRSAWPDIDVVTNLLLDASGHNIVAAAGRAAGKMLLWPVPPVWLLVQIAAIPFYAYVFAGFAEAARPRESPGLSRGARWLLLGVGLGLPALFLVLRVQGAPHYFLPALPVTTALVVAGARRRIAWPARVRRWVLPLPVLVGVNVASWAGFQSYVAFHQGSDSYGLPYTDVLRASLEVERAAEAAGIPRERPLRLRVDVPRDRGPLPAQYRFVLERRLGRPVTAAAEGSEPELTLRIRWPRPADGDGWEVVPAGTVPGRSGN